MFVKCNCEYIVGDNESIDSALANFNKLVKEHNILKDWKMNVMMSREERKKFKRFIRERRFKKKQQRIQNAINRMDNG